MAERIMTLIDVTAPSRLQITKWKVRKGSKVSQGAVLGFYKLVNGKNDSTTQDKTEEGELTSPNSNQLHKLKANHVGTVSDVLVEEGKEMAEGVPSVKQNFHKQSFQELPVGRTYSHGTGSLQTTTWSYSNSMSANTCYRPSPHKSVVLQIKGCSHPTVMKDMCADCGADLRSEMGMFGCRKENVSATVAMVHSIPELIISEEQALELGRADEIRLKKTRRLVLLVDLDQTLIHTTNDNIPPNLKGIHHFQLWQGMNLLWYHTRIRPHTQQFLENISKLYELHICTFGVRMYAHTIARFIDPAGKFFSHRILSRDECFNAMSKTANLKALFPCGDSMVCIIDDREDVWNFAPNLIHVKPYRFFQGTADINAPPGLTKKENDSKPITHVRKVIANSNSPEKGKGTSMSSKHKYKASKNVEAEKMEVEELGEQKVEEEEKVITLVSKEEKADAASEEQDIELVGNGNTDAEGDSPTETKGVENLSVDLVSKEKDIALVDKDIVHDDGSDSPTGKKDDENLSVDVSNETETKSLHSKEEEESKSDEEDGLKAEDLEGLSEDSSMSGMSLCDNGSKNASGKNDDSNIDEIDDENDDEDDDNKMIEWEDNDDYLFYLEEILQRIHTAYFNISDKLSEGSASNKDLNLKSLIPHLKRKVLKGCNICFSGVIPLNTPVNKCRAYNVALSLGANVHEMFIPYCSKTKSNYTTHLIANKMGTSKVHAAQRASRVSIVSLDWLWSCSERWDHVNEKLFLLTEKCPLNSDTSQLCPELAKSDKSSLRKRKIDRGPDDDDVFLLETKSKKIEDSESSEEELKDESSLDTEDSRDDKNNNKNSDKNNDDPKKLKRAGSHYNPLYSFSDEELASMDKELEELMDEEESDSDEKEAEAQLRKQILSERKCDTSSDDSLSGEFPHGWKSKKWPKCRSGKKKVSIKRAESLDGEDSEASISEKYEKSIEVFAAHASDSSNDDSDCESIGSIDAEIAEAVEKEFLAR